jgi:hypothetical protein
MVFRYDHRTLSGKVILNEREDHTQVIFCMLGIGVKLKSLGSRDLHYCHIDSYRLSSVSTETTKFIK